MDNGEIKFLNDSTALAKTLIYFASDLLVKEDNKSKKNIKRWNNIMFRKMKGEWYVKEVSITLILIRPGI